MRLYRMQQIYCICRVTGVSLKLESRFSWQRMAAGRVLRNISVYLIFVVILKSFHAHNSRSVELSNSSAQLCNLYVGKCTSVVSYGVFASHTKMNVKNNMESVPRSKRMATLLRHLKLTLAAELNVSLYLLLCGDVLSNPGPDSVDFNTFKLPAKGLRFGHWNVNYLKRRPNLNR